ncbi:Peptide chain release factor RF3 [Candidatus Profftia lariciata]|uniref:peptide chain release factor 3 n=1 Tax=Candidatus Profftia lariciata TaxID=1987921 RepID=UPI001D01336A|nr:peptide chain release factor 3 [Candidatus Profftia lariciata]UDG81759.1 Peptide chain release factor RF3 [Candidatus Profftia lariciata]
MSFNKNIHEILKRRNFAIISHPDAGKTTITEKILLFGRAIQKAGTIKSRGSNKYAKSDWMEIEKQRGISITTSVMQFTYRNYLINLLDTPGHADFSEDTYRTITAVDSCLMVIDATKGVEERTKKLIKITRMRNTPIITFMNKLDREIHNSIELLDLVEKELNIACAPITWPIGCGKTFRGVYHFYKNLVYLYKTGQGHIIQEDNIIEGLENITLDKVIGSNLAKQIRDELEFVKDTTPYFNKKMFLNGTLTPVFFGTALGNFGINHMLDSLVQWSPSPMLRLTNIRTVYPFEEQFTGFVFKIQANMDPKHRDRIAFIRIVSGHYKKNMKIYHVRTGKYMVISDAVTLMVEERSHIQEAYAGDIIGLHNHGTIKIGDTFTQGENINFIGIPNFSPEIFRRITLHNPIKQKQLLKGLVQLSEEGAVQIFRPINNNDLIVGAIGVLQFEVIVARLKNEYNVLATYESVNIITVRWLECKDMHKFELFKRKNELHLALDDANNLVYIAPTIINLNMIRERYPEIKFLNNREH